MPVLLLFVAFEESSLPQHTDRSISEPNSIFRIPHLPLPQNLGQYA